jgi:hypothetical protein
MEKPNTSLGNLWLPYVVAVAMVAVGIIGGPRSAPTRPSLVDAGLGELTQEAQNIPARLWQDPLEATEAVRRALHSGHEQSAPLQTSIPIDRLIWDHTHFDCVMTANGQSDCAEQPHRVLFQFVSLPSDAYPEAGEQRIRARVAVVSALSTAGYRPADPNRLGVTLWQAAVEDGLTSQFAYAFEVFQLDSILTVLNQGRRLGRKFDEIVVVYVEQDALRLRKQFQWLTRLSRLLADQSPKERFTCEHPWVSAQWLGPITSDQLIALLRSVGAEYASGNIELEPAQGDAVPMTVLAVRPTMDPSFVSRIVAGGMPGSHVKAAGPWKEFGDALKNESRHLQLAQRCNECGELVPWITLERLGCDDASLTDVLVHELKLRRPQMFQPAPKPHAQPTAMPTLGPSLPAQPTPTPTPFPGGMVVLLSEWDTLYGQVLPESFARNFTREGGHSLNLKRYTYLRGLDGQIAAGLDKPAATLDKRTSDVTKLPDSIELFRQLLKSHAPGIAFGRTQVDYVDRFAAQLRATQRTDPSQHLEAVGILGSDPYDKLLILQGLRKEFPSVLYFTTQMDASLFAPDNYDVTRNLIVATGFDLVLHDKYQRKILPFRDSNQASLYFATLYASEYLKMKQNQESVGAPFEEWYPSIVEIGRGGPFALKTQHKAGAFDDRRSTQGEAPVPGESPSGPHVGMHSPLVDVDVGPREAWQRWLVPLVAIAVVLVTTLTHFGRLAVRHAIEASATACRQFYLFLRYRGGRSTFRHLFLRLRNDVAAWLLIVATLMFVGVAFWIPRIAQLPDQEPFAIAEGISSWPATWLRALGVFLCACYFWIIAWQFRHALGSANRELALTAPDCCEPGQRPPRPTPCKAWDHFRRRSRGVKIKLVILFTWIGYVGLAFILFKHLELPAQVTRGPASIAWEQGVLFCAVFSINLLIIYGVVHNLSCSFFVRKVADWLGNPDAFAESDEPLHTALMRSIGYVAGAMTQMIYYPFTLLFLLMAARHSLFDNFDWPVLLVTVFAISSGVLLASTLVLRRSADQARKNAVTWLQNRIASLNWQMTAQTTAAVRRRSQVALQRAEWQLGQVNQVGGAALSEGIFSNPLLRAVLIPLGGTGVLQLMETAGKIF